MSKAPKQTDVVLCVNAGSSSLKASAYKLESNDVQWVADASISGVGAKSSQLSASHRGASEKQKEDLSDGLKDHVAAFQHVLSHLERSVKLDLQSIQHICHRVVHGGRYTDPMVLDKEAIDYIRRLSDLAPLHNGPALSVIEACHDLMPHAVPIAMFDTMFHTSIPQQIYTYAIDPQVAKERGLRRYGFHGLSYAFILSAVAKHLKKEASQLNLIVLHLGSGASACCVKNGQSLDTSMGLTPLSGLPGSTRAGQVDPSLIFHYTNKAKAITHDREMASNLHVTDAEYILNSQSGWNAIAGTKEFGDITAKAFQQLGDNPEQFYPGPGAKADLPPEALAFAIFVDRIIDYVAPYHMKLNGEVDAIVFSGGVGEKSHQLRSVLAHRLKCLGYPTLDRSKNEGADAVDSVVVDLADPSVSDKRVLMCHTDEQLHMARLCASTAAFHQ